MKKASCLLILLILLLWSCATYQPPPPSFYLGSLPQAMVAELSLDERILLEDAWKNLRQGKGNKAKSIISKLGSRSPFYNTGLGYAYYLLNEFQNAEKFFQAALADHPDMILTHLGLAQIYQATEREDLAFAEYREVLKREPDNPWAKTKYESIKDQRTQDALSEAKIYLAEGNTENSRAAYLKALYYSPAATEAHLALADIYKKENNLRNALVHLKAASTNEPQNTEILKIYGDALFQAEEHKKSLEIYERIQELEPGNQEIKTRLEMVKNRLGIFELPSQYDEIRFSDAVSNEGMAALLGIKLKDILEEPSENPPIIIDIATSWASKFILKMTSLNILDVYPNHTFQPKKIITRAKMAEILIRLIDHLIKKGYKFIQQIPPEKIQLTDVTADNYYHQPIIRIISYDIMTLSQDKSFQPDLPVSGEESIRLLNIILALIQ